jgi:hypothetical protein
MVPRNIHTTVQLDERVRGEGILAGLSSTRLHERPLWFGYEMSGKPIG